MKNGKYVILCVDDDPDVIDWLQVVLSGNGYEVVTADNAEEGRRKYKEHNPDLLIIDLMMEEIDAGTSLVRDLKAIGAKAPIYMLSSAGDDLNVTTNYAELGLTGVFQKPIQPDTLLSILKEKLK